MQTDPNTPDNRADRLKRLRFLAWRRGFREMDLIMGRFADARIEGLGEAGLAEFERLLDAPDQEVYAWISGRAETPSNFDGPVLQALKAYRFEDEAASGDGPSA